MMRVGSMTLALAGGLVAANTCVAQTMLTLPQALARAREQAPPIVSARLAIDEARARLVGTTHSPFNPEVDGALGNRQGGGTRSIDLDFGVSQALEPGGRRSARTAIVTAGVDQRVAELEAVTRLALRDTALAFLRTVYFGERLRLIDRTAELADNVLQIADRRFRSGDIAILDVNIARASLARTRAERQGTLAERAAALGELKELLQIEGDLAVDGDLNPASDPELTALLNAALDRPEIRVLNAAIVEAEAEGQFGRSFQRPEYSLGARYQREDGDHIVLGGLTVSLPFVSKGQEPIAVGAARAARLRAEAATTLVRIRIEVRAALEAYQNRRAAVQALEREALPGLDENDGLTTRSFEVGQLGLAELLLIRREILDTRFQYLDARFEAAVARVEVDARAGVLR